MTWAREVSFFLNTAFDSGLVLFRDKNGQAPAARSDWVSADNFPVNLWLIKPSTTFGQNPSIESLAPGDKIVLSGKATATGQLLFLATDWTETGAGDDLKYVAELDLNTTELNAAFGSNSFLNIKAEFEIQNADNTRRKSAQFELRILKQIYAGEGPPASAVPPWPAAPLANRLLGANAGGTGWKQYTAAEAWALLNSVNPFYGYTPANFAGPTGDTSNDWYGNNLYLYGGASLSNSLTLYGGGITVTNGDIDVPAGAVSAYSFNGNGGGLTNLQGNYVVGAVDNAYHAGSADSAENANSAGVAGFASSADIANAAYQAGTLNTTRGYAGGDDNANPDTVAVRNGSADLYAANFHATYGFYGDGSNLNGYAASLVVGTADTAGSAGSAGYAGNAGYADQAGAMLDTYYGIVYGGATSAAVANTVVFRNNDGNINVLGGVLVDGALNPVHVISYTGGNVTIQGDNGHTYTFAATQT